MTDNLFPCSISVMMMSRLMLNLHENAARLAGSYGIATPDIFSVRSADVVAASVARAELPFAVPPADEVAISSHLNRRGRMIEREDFNEEFETGG